MHACILIFVCLVVNNFSPHCSLQTIKRVEMQVVCSCSDHASL